VGDPTPYTPTWETAIDFLEAQMKK